MKYLILLAILAGCGKNQAPVVVDPALQPYMDDFQTDIGASTAGISAGFAANEGSGSLGEIVGECITSTDGSTTTKQINIDPNYWALQNEYGKKELFYHELGHCALNMVHIPTLAVLNGFNCPSSIMYPVTFGETYCFLQNISYYYQELAGHR